MNENIKNFLYTHRVHFIAVIVGILAAIGAVAFRAMIGFVQHLFFDQSIRFDLIDHLHRTQHLYEIAFPIFGLLISHWLIEQFASEARGHGVPEVIEAVQHKAGIIRKRVAVIKTLASSFTIGSGGSLGREGPIVQIGAAIGSFLGQTLRLRSKEVKTLVACGASAGIAATFNTPIAAVIFSVELILLEWRAISFIPLVIATVFATLLSRNYLGDQPAFSIREFALVSNLEIFFYLFLGISTGFAAYGFIHGIDWIEKQMKSIIRNDWARCVIGGGIIGSIAYFFPHLYGGGYEATDALIHEQVAVSLLVWLIVLKVISVSLTLASGGSGGVFAPSLLMGALTGALYGVIVHSLFPEQTMSYGVYALVGMGSFFAAVSRGTFTSIVILFEMSRNYSIILPLMFACVISDQVAVLLLKEDTIYGKILRRKKLTFSTDFGVDRYVMTPIWQIMVTRIECIRSGTLVENAWNKVHTSQHTVYPVTNTKGVLLGAVSYFDLALLAKKHGKKTVDELMRGTPCVVYPDDSAQSVIEKLERTRDPRAFVIDRENRALLGLVTPTDLIRYKDLD
ncbi:MAG: chloride channel protein [Deltaproteobacteria bacterium]|nr:chloride channel protein [Deltaproteobacteria bacterium]